MRRKGLIIIAAGVVATVAIAASVVTCEQVREKVGLAPAQKSPPPPPPSGAVPDAPAPDNTITSKPPDPAVPPQPPSKVEKTQKPSPGGK